MTPYEQMRLLHEMTVAMPPPTRLPQISKNLPLSIMPVIAAEQKLREIKDDPNIPAEVKEEVFVSLKNQLREIDNEITNYSNRLDGRSFVGGLLESDWAALQQLPVMNGYPHFQGLWINGTLEQALREGNNRTIFSSPFSYAWVTNPIVIQLREDGDRQSRAAHELQTDHVVMGRYWVCVDVRRWAPNQNLLDFHVMVSRVLAHQNTNFRRPGPPTNQMDRENRIHPHVNSRGAWCPPHMYCPPEGQEMVSSIFAGSLCCGEALEAIKNSLKRLDLRSVNEIVEAVLSCYGEGTPYHSLSDYRWVYNQNGEPISGPTISDPTSGGDAQPTSSTTTPRRRSSRAPYMEGTSTDSSGSSTSVTFESFETSHDKKMFLVGLIYICQPNPRYQFNPRTDSCPLMYGRSGTRVLWGQPFGLPDQVNESGSMRQWPFSTAFSYNVAGRTAWVRCTCGETPAVCDRYPTDELGNTALINLISFLEVIAPEDVNLSEIWGTVRTIERWLHENNLDVYRGPNDQMDLQCDIADANFIELANELGSHITRQICSVGEAGGHNAEANHESDL